MILYMSPLHPPQPKYKTSVASQGNLVANVTFYSLTHRLTINFGSVLLSSQQMGRLEAVENAAPHMPLVCSSQRYRKLTTMTSLGSCLKSVISNNEKDKRLNGKDKQLKEFTSTWKRN
jgi:hypothetical protein